MERSSLVESLKLKILAQTANLHEDSLSLVETVTFSLLSKSVERPSFADQFAGGCYILSIEDITLLLDSSCDIPSLVKIYLNRNPDFIYHLYKLKNDYFFTELVKILKEGKE